MTLGHSCMACMRACVACMHAWLACVCACIRELASAGAYSVRAALGRPRPGARDCPKLLHGRALSRLTACSFASPGATPAHPPPSTPPGPCLMPHLAWWQTTACGCGRCCSLGAHRCVCTASCRRELMQKPSGHGSPNPSLLFSNAWGLNFMPVLHTVPCCGGFLLASTSCQETGALYLYATAEGPPAWEYRSCLRCSTSHLYTQCRCLELQPHISQTCPCSPLAAHGQEHQWPLQHRPWVRRV